jgi:hypothetical protein
MGETGKNEKSGRLKPALDLDMTQRRNVYLYIFKNNRKAGPGDRTSCVSGQAQRPNLSLGPGAYTFTLVRRHDHLDLPVAYDTRLPGAPAVALRCAASHWGAYGFGLVFLNTVHTVTLAEQP